VCISQPGIDEKKKKQATMELVRKTNSNIRRYRVDAEWEGFEGIYGSQDDFHGTTNYTLRILFA
jgi:hypothetical protein